MAPGSLVFTLMPEFSSQSHHLFTLKQRPFGCPFIMKKNNLLALFLLFVLSGCQSKFGPGALKNTHAPYNQALVQTLNEQMLLNLVRMKYRDKPFFLKVGSITAALTFGGSLGMETELGVGSGGSLLEPQFGFSYADKPTISYTPLQG